MKHVHHHHRMVWRWYTILIVVVIGVCVIWGVYKGLHMVLFTSPPKVVVDVGNENDDEVIIWKTKPLVERNGKMYETYIWGLAIWDGFSEDELSTSIKENPWTNARYFRGTSPIQLLNDDTHKEIVLNKWKPEFDTLRDEEEGTIIRLMSESGQENDDVDVIITTEHVNEGGKDTALTPPTQYTYDVARVDTPGVIERSSVHPKQLYVLREHERPVNV